MLYILRNRSLIFQGCVIIFWCFVSINKRGFPLIFSCPDYFLMYSLIALIRTSVSEIPSLLIIVWSKLRACRAISFPSEPFCLASLLSSSEALPDPLKSFQTIVFQFFQHQHKHRSCYSLSALKEQELVRFY